MDTRALGGEFLPRGEILTVEMKTVTQYTGLIRLTAQMEEQERIPDLRGRKREKAAQDRSLISITRRGIQVNGRSRESVLYTVFPQELLEFGRSFTGFHNPFPLQTF